MPAPSESEFRDELSEQLLRKLVGTIGASGSNGEAFKQLGVLLVATWINTRGFDRDPGPVIWDLRDEVARNLQLGILDERYFTQISERIGCVLSFVTEEDDLTDFLVHEIFSRAISDTHEQGSTRTTRVMELLWSFSDIVPWLIALAYEGNEQFLEGDRDRYTKK